MRASHKVVLFVIPLLLAVRAGAAEMQALKGHVPRAVANLSPAARAPAAQRLKLSIGLPLRNRQALANLLREIYDPRSTNYHHYLTPTEFAARFGASEQDYAAVAAFAATNGMRVTARHSNRTLLDVEGSVADVEKALHVQMNNYRHPSENRNFFAPDREPSVDLAVPIVAISGLNNYARPRPRFKASPMAAMKNAKPAFGSGPGFDYMGRDFRAAYAPDTSLTGSGQFVGLVQFDGYSASDITQYESIAGLPNVPLTNVLLDGFDGNPTGNGNEVEVCLDIEMSISMAPGLSGVILYEAGPDGDWHDVLNRIATDNLARQISCSWFQPDAGADPVADQIWQQMAAQGQTFFNASGDDGAFTGLIPFPEDSPYITEVGGTTLTTAGPGGAWVSETAWNWLVGIATGGGISTQYPIPAWQAPVDMSANAGSSTMRNTPDVAMTADEVYVRADGFDLDVGGTSCASPLWAGFTALMNQQAAAYGQPSVGFLNPTVYSLGLGPTYGTVFHDTAAGNNGIPSMFPATTGYDLCTGWGTPTGQALIDAIVPPDTLAVAPRTGFSASGSKGGPFSIATQVFSLKNGSSGPLAWSLGGTPVWLDISATSGSLAAGNTTNLLLRLNQTATNLQPAIYTANLLVTNRASGFVHTIPVVLEVRDPLVLSQTKGFNATGPVGGPFSVTSQVLTLSNSSSSSLQWQLSNSNSWLDASSTSGTLLPAATTEVTVNLDATAYSLPPALYAGNIGFSNLSAGTFQGVPFSLRTGEVPLQNGGFETGNFQGWVVPPTRLNGVEVSPNPLFVHSGTYGAQLLDGSLGQTIPTIPGKVYLISFWLDYADPGITHLDLGPETPTRDDFTVAWNGNTVFYQDSLGSAILGWTNYQIFVAATGTSSVLQFTAGLRGNADNVMEMGLDDVAVFQTDITGSPPSITSQPAGATVTAGLTTNLTVAATGTLALNYQWQLGNSNVAGATNATLLLSPARPEQAGTYHVTVSNEFGVTNSTNAVLTVNLPDCVSAPPGLVGWWAGEGTAQDSIGTNDGILKNGAGFAPGVAGQAFNFNGAGQYVDVPDNALLNPAQSITCDAWVYPRSFPITSYPSTIFNTSASIPIIEKAGVDTFYSFGYVLKIDSFTGAEFSVWVSARGWCTSAPVEIPFDQWSHVAGVYDGTNVSIYLNGALAGPPTSAPGIMTPSVKDLQIGHHILSPSIRFDADTYLNGMIDEATVYNTALSAAQIQAIYNSGSAGKCPTGRPVIVTQPANQTAFPGVNVTFAVGAKGTAPRSYQWQVNGNNIPGATNDTLTVEDIQPIQSGYNYSVTVTNIFGATNSTSAALTVAPPGTCFPPPAGLVSWWAGQGNAEDWLGTNNGTLFGGVSFTNGEVGQAMQFDGTSGYIRIPASPSLDVGMGQGFTIEGWIQPASLLVNTPLMNWNPDPPKQGNILNGVTFGINYPPPFGFGSGSLYALVQDTNGSANFLASPAGILNTNIFQHVAMTFDNATGTITLYCNGTVVATQAGVPLNPQTRQDLFFGVIPGINSFYSGLMDEFSLYNVVLSSNQIQAIYNVGRAGKCPGAPVIVSQPQSQGIAVGLAVTLSVTANGSPPLTYQWQVNGTNIPMATNSSLVLTNVQSAQSGSLYSVLVGNAGGVTPSSNAVLTVVAPGSCMPPPSGLLGWWEGEGNAADALGLNNGVLMNGAGFAPGEVGHAFKLNGTNQYVMIPNASGLNLGNQFTIDFWMNYDASNALNPAAIGLVSSDYYGIEWAPGPTGIYTYLSTNNGQRYIVSAAQKMFPAGQWHHVASVYDGMNVQMYLDGQPWGGPTAVTGNISPMRDGNFVALGSEDERSCSCLNRRYKGLLDEVDIFNRALSPSEITTLYIAGSAGKCTAAPVIAAQPQSQTVLAGTPVNFSVSATGTQPLGYQWSLNGTNIPVAANPTAVSATLALTNPQAANAGSYSVAVTNIAGATNSTNALLTLLYPPAITLQPAGQSVQPGCSVIFNSAATGTAPLTYQWELNGSNLPTQTGASLAILHVQPSQFGTYTMIVSNAYGQATSSVAVLALDHSPIPGSVVVQRYSNGGVRLNVSSLLTHATDPDGDLVTLTAIDSNSAAGGKVTLGGASIYYQPPAGNTNADSFDYTLSDGHCGGTATGTVQVQVRGDTNPASHVTIIQPGDGTVQVIFDGMPGTVYRVQSADNLSPADWQDVAQLTADQFGTYLYVGHPSSNGPARYFRSVSP